jgi:hypothetical protein
MIGDEFEVRYKRAKRSQPGNDSVWILTPTSFPFVAMKGSISIASCSKILFFKWTTGSDENAPVSQQFRSHHGNIYSMSSGRMAG